MEHFVYFSCGENVPEEHSDEKKYLTPCLILLRELSKEGIYYELSVNIVSDDEIREVNLEHRQKNAPTDVLSFPMLTEETFPGAEGRTVLGDILISYETCRRQAHEIGHSFEDEMMRLMVHGILHLFGYDHETSEEDARIMKRKEDELLDILSEEGY